MAYSFYGGKQGPSYKIVAHYDSIYDMVIAFQEGGDYNTVGYGEYVIIDTICNNNQYSNPENGIIYRRGLNYIQNFDPNGKVSGTIDGIQLKTVAKEAVVNGNKIYYDITYDEDNNPVYTFNEQRFRETFATFVQNPGGGAQYVGQIVGPQGSSPQLNITTWEDLMEKMESSEAANLHKDSVYQIAHPAVELNEDGGIDNENDIQDNINYAYLDILDAYGNIVGSYIAFDIPSPVFSYHAESISPYQGWDSEDEKTHYATWNEENNRWEYANLISEDDISKSHPYYWQYDIKVPEGIHGQDFTSFGINLPSEEYPIQRNSENGNIINTDEGDILPDPEKGPNHHYQFYYTLTDYATKEQGRESDRIYVKNGFLRSILETKGNNAENTVLDLRRSNYYYHTGERVSAPGLPVKQVVISNEQNKQIYHIFDLCLQAKVDASQPYGGQTREGTSLDSGVLAKLTEKTNEDDGDEGHQIYDGNDYTNKQWQELQVKPEHYTGVIWKVKQNPVQPLNLLKVYYTYDGHDEISIRSVEGIAQKKDGTVYVKYSDDNSIYTIGENQSIEDVEHVQTVEINGKNVPINRFCIHYNTYNRDANGEIVIDDAFEFADSQKKEITHFPTTDANGKKIEYIDTIIRFIDKIETKPDSKEVIVYYSDGTSNVLGSNRAIVRLDIQNGNYIGGTQKFIAEYNTHNDNPGTNINDKQILSKSLNTVAAIRQHEDNIIILYSDPAVRKNLNQDSIIRIPYDGNANTGYKIENCNYSVYDENNSLYEGDDPNESYVLYWYNTGHIYRGNRIYRHFDNLSQLQSSDIHDGIKDEYYKGWIVTVGDPENPDVIKLYAYDYVVNQWYQLSEFDISTVNPEYSLIIREPLTNNENIPQNDSMLKENGYWFVINVKQEDN